MALLMKAECEKCAQQLPIDALVFICSYECTFCQSCTQAMQHVCPNCSGELLQRPRRTQK